MIENKPSTRLDSADDAPDLSAPEWQQRFAQAKVHRGRPKLARAKISTTIRFDPDVLAFFRNGGEGWQTRINDALRDAMRRKIKKPGKEKILVVRPDRSTSRKRA
jgi:uncharacterized protein (DUF4415 family)